MKQSNYYVHYDIIRIFLTILVVLGHGTFYTIVTPFGGINYTEMMNDAFVSDTAIHIILKFLTNWIYTYHMPVFMALSGMVFVKQLKNNKYTKFKDLLVAKWKRIGIPLITVWFVYNVPIKYLSGYYASTSIFKIFLQFVFSDSVYLWYLEALLLDFIFAYLLVRCVKVKILQNCIVVILFFVGMALSHISGQYMILGNPLMYLMWFWIGMNLNSIVGVLKRHNIWNKYYITALFGIHIVVWIFTLVIQKATSVINITIQPALMLLVVYYIILKISDRLTDRQVQKIKKCAGYTFGVYLYAEPLNYLVLYLAYMFFGITIFGTIKGSLIIYLVRILITPAVAVKITDLLKRAHLDYLY